jgi:hypothetical protein
MLLCGPTCAHVLSFFSNQTHVCTGCKDFKTDPDTLITFVPNPCPYMQGIDRTVRGYDRLCTGCISTHAPFRTR